MREICRTLPIEIEVLTPVHIGSGEENLVMDYDFAFAHGQVWVIDQLKMLSTVPDEKLEASIDWRIPHILRPNQYRECSRYVMAIPGNSAPSEICPCIKDIEDRPYLPGSSLKGAIRTALAWDHLSSSSNLIDSVGRHPKFAASQLETQLFGRDPNHNIMRALNISDSSSVEAKPSLSAVSLMSLRGDSLAPKGPGYRFFLETIAPGTKLQGNIRIDEFLFGPHAARAELAIKRSLIDGLSTSCRSFTTSLIRHEIEFFSQMRHTRAHQEYERLRQTNRSLSEGQFLMQIGWGTGWQSKTVGTGIDQRSLRELIRRFNLDRGRGAPFFPKTRRLVEANGIPALPLGWIMITIKGDLQ